MSPLGAMLLGETFIMHPFTPNMMNLFEGNPSAHGKYVYHNEIRADGKVKGNGITIRQPVTASLWDDHLLGTSQLGIIPINQDSMCKFGAIDIDDYKINHKEINLNIHKYKMPLVLFRSKSGGAHLFLFLSDFAPASLIQTRLREMAALLGHGNAEIFPKQTMILKDRGDIGQWINMPYYDANKTTRYATQSEDGEKLSIQGFIKYIDTKRITPEDLEGLILVPQEGPLEEAPPCLQHLVQSGFPPGTRNQGLLNLGVYAKKLNPDKWKFLVEEYNQKYMKPPLEAREVLIIISSLDKKEYCYMCKKPPIMAHCNFTHCRTMKYGVGDSNTLPAFGSLTKLDAEPPIWFLDVEGGGRLELSTEDIQNPARFQLRCMESLNILPQMPKKAQWQVIIAELLNNITIIPVQKESTPAGRLIAHLEEFCLNRGSEDEQNLFRGLVWNYDGKHHFKMNDFLAYLERKKFFEFKSNKIGSILRDNGCESKGLNIKRKYVNVLTIKMFQDVEPIEPPSQEITVPY